MAATQQAGEECLAPADRPAAHEAPSVGIVADQALVPLEISPADIALMMVGDQNLPRGPFLAEPLDDPLASSLDGRPAAGAAKGVGAGIDRIGEHVVQSVVDGQLPGDVSALGAVVDAGQRQSLLAHPQMDLAHCLQLVELGEHKRNCILDTAVWILLDSVIRRLEITDCHRQQQLATPGFLFEGFERALAKQREFHLAHCSLHAQEQPVIRMPWVVHAVFVEDQRTDKTTKVEQGVPVAAVACQPRGLDGHDGTDPSLTDRGQEFLETRAGNARARFPEVIVNYLDCAPAERAGTFDKAILAPPALMIVEHLVGSGLADIHEGAAAEVLRRDPGHRRPPCRLGLTRSSAGAHRRPPSEEIAKAAPASTEHSAAAPPSPSPARTDLSGRVPWSSCPTSSSGIDSPREEATSASTNRRTSARLCTGSRGSERSGQEDAAGSVIHLGSRDSVPSG